MHSPEQIVALVQKASTKEKKSGEHKDGYPFYPGYSLAVELADKIAVHTTYGIFPDKLFHKKAPNQDPKEFEYQRAIYPQPPITMPYWQKAMGVLNRIWNDSNWGIQWKDDAKPYSDTETKKGLGAKDYFEKDYPVFGSYEAYHKEIFMDRKIQDPNAIAVIKPYRVPFKEVVIDDKPAYVIDDEVMVEPIEVIYDSKDIWAYKDEEYLLVLTPEKTFLENKQKIGRVFEFYDEVSIWRLEQYGIESQNTYRINLYYTHNLGILPCRKLRGRPVYINGVLIYQSYFLPAVSLLDEALRNFSTKQMSTYANAFSIMWEYFDKCDHQGCDNGKIRQNNEHGSFDWVTCTTCKGTGNRNKHSPTGVYQLRVPNRLEDGDTQVPTPPVGFVAPGTEILDYLAKDIKESIQQAFAILNFDISNSDVKGSDTALGKQIDREEMFSFLLRISNEIFDSFEWGIYVMGLMRYGFNASDEAYFKMPDISRPRNFSIRSDEDLTAEINSAKDSGLPDIAVREILSEWINTRFSTGGKASKVVDIVFRVDRIVTMSNLDINAGIAMGTVAKWEAVLHASIYTFIDEIISENPGFLEQDHEKQKTALVDKAKQVTLEISPAVNTPDQILERISI